MNIISLISQAVRKKINPLLVQVRKIFNPTYIKNKGKVFFSESLTGLLNFKPKDEDDYYLVGRWMIAKKLAFTLILAILFINILVFHQIWPNTDNSTSMYKVYNYNAIGLKFYEGTVNILNENDNVAYVGSVSAGQVVGQGKLYDDAGMLVYEGEFDQNQYNGAGTFYEAGMKLYEGDFVDNLYQGVGTLYASDGSKVYEGDFLAGKKHGVGTLYNTSGSMVYTGNFVSDYLRYEDIVGKTTSEVSELYQGSKDIYTYDDIFAVDMTDINAMYVGTSEESVEDNGWTISGVYVRETCIPYGNAIYDNVNELEKAIGELLYEGSTAPEPMDAVAMKLLEDQGNTRLSEDYDIELSELYANSFEVESYDKTCVIYIYQYQIDDFVYTFFSDQTDGSFQMYLIEKA